MTDEKKINEEINELEQQIVDVKAYITQIEKDWQEATDKLTELQTKHETLTNEKKESKISVDKAKTSMDELKAQILQLHTKTQAFANKKK